MWYSFNDALVKNEEGKRDGKQLYDTSGSQRVDFRDGHTNEALAPPHNKGFDWGSRFHSNVNTIWLCGHNLWEWSEFLTVSPSGATSDFRHYEQKWITSFFHIFVTTREFYNNMTRTLTMMACVECDEAIRYSNMWHFFLYEPQQAPIMLYGTMMQCYAKVY